MHRTAPWVLALIALGGCVQVSDFDPVGTAASIRGGWSIDGQAPTEESCGLLGASFVRVAFVDGLRSVPHPGLNFRCAEPGCASNVGTAQCFDTAMNRVVAEGVWGVRLEATSGSGGLVAVGPTLTWDTASTEENANLVLADFSSGGVNAAWVIDGMAPTRAKCDELQIGFVSLAFDAAPGAVATTMKEPCAVGAIGSRLAPAAGYAVRVEIWNLDDTERVRDIPFEPFDVAPGTNVRLGGQGHAIELRTE